VEIDMDYLINAYEYLRPGGWIMVLLVVTSLWMWGLIIERFLFYRRMNRHDAGLKEAVNILSQRKAAKPLSGICRNLLSGFMQQRTGDSALDQRIMEQHAMQNRPRVRRFLSTITVLAATAPLFGLLGTVLGMITTFDVIALFGTGNAKALAGGISKALITTQSGLLVGIPGLFMGSLLTRRAHALEQRLTETVIALKRIV
jgi:biopolymer transport protein ExbB